MLILKINFIILLTNIYIYMTHYSKNGRHFCNQKKKEKEKKNHFIDV